ncbi:MAG: glmZ(sRNA)-inactivating NTPase [Microbacteriaceae bacterium BACL25 MAG-120322-bin65]|nr:MAG: glmZ(sRNA)-inactivating NTPase [Microbacteriaceae bacterium BACL25 MAG-120322-bin65]
MAVNQPQTRVLIVTGMSGAGRSTAANALEDHGWYVVDNLPPKMLRPLVDLADDPANDMPQLAAVIDVRGGSLFSDATDAIVALSHESNVEIVFLDSTNDVLVRRFEQVRRPHPLQEDGTLLDGIERERSLMQEIRERSDFVMDTSEMNIHQLSTAISKIYSEPEDARIRLTIISFGYKYGLPSDVDMVADMRFLPNPYWEESLRSLSGKDQAVSDYVTGNPLAKEFMDSYENSLAAVLRGYAGENKTFATLAIGCTGGKHRSVAMAENMANRLSGRDDIQVAVKHRDLGRE